jgi:hypothetical protein
VFREKTRLHKKTVKAKGKTVSALNYALQNEHEWRSEGMAPCILNLDNIQRSASTPLSPHNISRSINTVLIITSRYLRNAIFKTPYLFFGDLYEMEY